MQVAVSGMESPAPHLQPQPFCARPIISGVDQSARLSLEPELRNATTNIIISQPAEHVSAKCEVIYEKDLSYQ